MSGASSLDSIWLHFLSNHVMLFLFCGYIVSAGIVILSQFIRWLMVQRFWKLAVCLLLLSVILGSVWALNVRNFWPLLAMLLPIFRLSFAWKFKVAPKYRVPLAVAFVLSLGILLTYPGEFFDSAAFSI